MTPGGSIKHWKSYKNFVITMFLFWKISDYLRAKFKMLLFEFFPENIFTTSPEQESNSYLLP